MTEAPAILFALRSPEGYAFGDYLARLPIANTRIDLRHEGGHVWVEFDTPVSIESRHGLAAKFTDGFLHRVRLDSDGNGLAFCEVRGPLGAIHHDFTIPFGATMHEPLEVAANATDEELIQAVADRLYRAGATTAKPALAEAKRRRCRVQAARIVPKVLDYARDHGVEDVADEVLTAHERDCEWYVIDRVGEELQAEQEAAGEPVSAALVDVILAYAIQEIVGWVFAWLRRRFAGEGVAKAA